jgi:Flp pilus assembly pilin Flp
MLQLLLADRRGSELIENALWIAAVVVVCIVVLQALGVNIMGKFGEIVGALGG